MPEAHAKLSPSAAKRWMTCPGSLVLSSGIPSRSSEFAEEGTRAHSLAEMLLHGATCTKGGVVYNGLTYQFEPEMLQHVRVYTDHLDELFDECGVRMVEKRVEVSPECWGTADAIFWNDQTRTLYVRDLKYGAGVGVEVRGNLQLQIYALAALLTLKYPAKTVNVGVVQPRFSHPDGPIRSVDFAAVDLLDFYADLQDAIGRVKKAAASKNAPDWNDTYLHPSDEGCRWCPASPTCPVLKSRAQELAKVTFATGLAYDPISLSRTLDFLPILEAWAKNVREFAYSEAEQGRVCPGYKLVEKRASRKWRDLEAAKAYFGNAPEFYSTPELLSPAQIEKLIEKDERPKLDALTVKESSGHTLVHESDKRESVRIDAKSAFA